MFKLIKKIFSKKTKPETLVLTNPIKTIDEVKVSERPDPPKPTKPKKDTAKPVAKSASKPKKSTTQKPKKTAPKTAADLEKMAKAAIDLYAEKEYGIKLDCRKRKSDMIADFVEQRRNRKQK